MSDGAVPGGNGQELDDDVPQSDEAPPPPQPSMLDILRLHADEKKDWRRLPGMMRVASRLVWRSARWRAAGLVVVQTVQGLGVGAQLLAGNRVLSAAILARGAHAGAGDVLAPVAVFVGVTVALGMLGAVTAAQQQVLSELVSRHTYDQIIDTATSVDLAAFESPEFHDRLQRAVTAGQVRPWTLVNAVLSLTSALVTSIGITIALAALQPLFLPFVAVGAVPAGWAAWRNAKSRYRMIVLQVGPERERGYLRSLLTGKDAAKEVRVFNLTRFLRLRHDELSDQLLVQKRAQAMKELRNSLVGNLGGALAAVAVFGFLLWLFLSGRVAIAGAVTAAVAIQQLQGKLAGIATGAVGVYEGALYLEDYDSFVALKAALPRGQRDEARPFTRLEMRDVAFAYPGTERLVLDGANVEVRAGEIVALVGENGSGKTTLAKLLCSLYAPTSGQVLWDGRPLTELDQESVRAHIAVIFQDFVQYHLRARDNIAMGRYQGFDDLDAIAGAARQAGAQRFLEQLPNGWDTQMGREFTGGQDLSVGQWQRVALARAFFRDAPFIVLDEPTAALDARAEHQLFERIRQLVAGRAVLLISHRFSSVRSADRIYVLDKGRVVEHGTHAELMANEGLYAELFTLQAQAYLDEVS